VAGVAPKEDAIVPPLRVQPDMCGRAIEGHAQPAQLVLDQRVQRIEHQCAHRVRPVRVLPLADSRPFAPPPEPTVARVRGRPPRGFAGQCGEDGQQEALGLSRAGACGYDQVLAFRNRGTKRSPLVLEKPGIRRQQTSAQSRQSFVRGS